MPGGAISHFAVVLAHHARSTERIGRWININASATPPAESQFGNTWARTFCILHAQNFAATTHGGIRI